MIPLDSRQRWLLAIGGIVLVLIVLGLLGTCRQDSVNEELARTARTAVEMAHEAQRNNDAAYVWPGRLRLIALVVGITLPLAAAVVLVILINRHRQETDQPAVRCRNFMPVDKPCTLSDKPKPASSGSGGGSALRLPAPMPQSRAPPNCTDQPQQ